MTNNDEIAKLAREYAEEIRKDILPFFPQPLPDSMEVLVQKDQKEAERLIRFLLRTHCIVSKVGAEGEVLSGWVARDSNGNLSLFEVKPERVRYKRTNNEGLWMAKSMTAFVSDLFPPPLTWDDGPIEVEITIKPKKKSSTK